jgi:hypothetical protein
VFGVMGKIERGTDGNRKFTAAWTYDERMEDGLYSYHSLEMVRKWIEDPEQLVEPVEPPEGH